LQIKALYFRPFMSRKEQTLEYWPNYSEFQSHNS
jgi:hypothetical protein